MRTFQLVLLPGAANSRSAPSLIHRVNVYRLSDGHWDCYREEERQAA